MDSEQTIISLKSEILDYDIRKKCWLSVNSQREKSNVRNF